MEVRHSAGNGTPSQTDGRRDERGASEEVLTYKSFLTRRSSDGYRQAAHGLDEEAHRFRHGDENEWKSGPGPEFESEPKLYDGQTRVLSVRAEVPIDEARSIDSSPPTLHTEPGPRHPPNRESNEATASFRLAWMWVEGWRSRLRKGGDIVEKARWEWRVEDLTRGPNHRVPIIVARNPIVSVLKKPENRTDGGDDGAERKSVRWA